MKKYYSLLMLFVLSIFSLSVLADEWLDIAQDIQKRVVTQVPILPEDQKQIDINLIWANQCVRKQYDCKTDNEKQSIRETVQSLETLWKKYQDLSIKSPVLEYIVNKADTLRAMTDEDVPPMGPVVADIVLQIYYQDALQTYDMIYEREVTAKIEKHQNALRYLPE